VRFFFVTLSAAFCHPAPSVMATVVGVVPPLAPDLEFDSFFPSRHFFFPSAFFF